MSELIPGPPPVSKNKKIISGDWYFLKDAIDRSGASQGLSPGLGLLLQPGDRSMPAEKLTTGDQAVLTSTGSDVWHVLETRPLKGTKVHPPI